MAGYPVGKMRATVSVIQSAQLRTGELSGGKIECGGRKGAVFAGGAGGHSAEKNRVIGGRWPHTFPVIPTNTNYKMEGAANSNCAGGTWFRRIRTVK